MTTTSSDRSGPVPTVVVLSDRSLPVDRALAAAAMALAAESGAAVVMSQQLQLPEQALADLTADRPGGSSALTAGGAGARGVRVLHHRVIDVTTDRHACTNTNATAAGLIRLSGSDRQRAAAALADAVPYAPVEPDPENAFAWLVLVLVRAGIPLKAEPVDPWPWQWNGAPVGLSDDEADRIRLLRANRADDGFYSVHVLRRLSKPLSALGAARGWSPNAITLVSLAVGLAAAGLFATGERWAMVLGAILLQASIIIDCSDGEVARLTGRYSTVGAWLDAATDRVKEYAAYAGLAAGAVAGGAEMWIWWLAGATMTLQTGRHLSDYTFHQVQVRRETAGVVRPLSDTTARGSEYSGIVAAAGRANEHSLLRSLKKMIFLPIGERWLIISLTAALLSPRWTFTILLVAGALSASYAFTGRVLRTVTWPRLATGADIVAPQVDASPVATAESRLIRTGWAAAVLWAGMAVWVSGIVALPLPGAGPAAILLLIAAATAPAAGLLAAGQRFAWALPSALAVAELATWLVATAALAPESAPWGFALAGVVAFHRYDLLYRAMAGAPAPQWIVTIGGGTDGRLIVIAVVALAGAAAYAAALPWLCLLLSVTCVVVASAQWVATSLGARA